MQRAYPKRGLRRPQRRRPWNWAKEHWLVGLNLDVGRRLGSQVPDGLLHDPLGGDQVDDGLGCIVEVHLGPVVLS
jgi:hypothetical protein